VRLDTSSMIPHDIAERKPAIAYITEATIRSLREASSIPTKIILNSFDRKRMISDSDSAIKKGGQANNSV